MRHAFCVASAARSFDEMAEIYRLARRFEIRFLHAVENFRLFKTCYFKLIVMRIIKQAICNSLRAASSENHDQGISFIQMQPPVMGRR